MAEAMGVVYMFTCRVNGKKYIGQTWNIETRLAAHRRAKGESRIFHLAVRKYGFDSFDFEILQDGIDTQAHLDIVEWQEIRQKETMAPGGYNLADGGGSGTRMSEEAKRNTSKAATRRFSDPEQRTAMAEKIRQFHADPVRGAAQKEKIRKAWESNPEYRRRVLEAGKRRSFDAAWRAKNTAAQRERSNRLRIEGKLKIKLHAKWGSPEHRAKMSEAGKKSTKPVFCIELCRCFLSSKQACEELGFGKSGISNLPRAIRLGCKMGGYHWRRPTMGEIEYARA